MSWSVVLTHSFMTLSSPRVGECESQIIIITLTRLIVQFFTPTWKTRDETEKSTPINTNVMCLWAVWFVNSETNFSLIEFYICFLLCCYCTYFVCVFLWQSTTPRVSFLCLAPNYTSSPAVGSVSLTARRTMCLWITVELARGNQGAN